MKRKFLALLVLISVSMMLFAGGSKEAKQEESAASGETVLQVIDWSDSSLAFREEFHKKFEANHPGVKIEYTCLTTDQFNNTIVTSIRSGDAPDVFPIPSGRTLSMAIQENWFMPMDDYVTDEFVASLDESIWQEGITTQGGKIYTLPENMPLINSVIYYNKSVLEDAGVTEVPKTYSEFLDACVKVSEAGNGRFYGWIDGGRMLNRLDILVRGFAGKAGAKIPQYSSILTVNGRAPYDSDEIKGVMELFKNIVEQGGMHPDTLNIGAPEAREMFAQGQAAFLVQGMWCIPTWSQTYPDMDYGVMDIPVPDELADDPYRYGAPAGLLAPWLGISSTCEHPELAAEYIMCLFSEEYGYQQAQVESGNSISIVPAVNDKYMTNEVMRSYYETAIRNSREIPVATTRDERVYDFYAAVRDVTPNLGNIFQGILSNSISDYDTFLKQFADNSTAEWKRAAESIGLDFNVFEFPNWDMSKDYTIEDYAELPALN